MTKDTRTQTQYRDSVKGTFTTKQEAAQRPRETERERIKHPAPAPAPKRGK
jgi:hypothetical protein